MGWTLGRRERAETRPVKVRRAIAESPDCRGAKSALTCHACPMELRLEPHALPQFGSVVHRPVADHVLNLARVVNVDERIGGEQD